MWKPEQRKAACRKGLRYDSDLTDEEWALVAPLIPPAKHGGRKRDVNVREILNAIFYVLRTGCHEEDEFGRQVGADATALTRMTRRHDQVRQGSSVRGAIDLARLIVHLCAVRDIQEPRDERYRKAVREAMGVALTGRLLIDEATDATPERVLNEIWESYFILDPAAAQPG